MKALLMTSFALLLCALTLPAQSGGVIRPDTTGTYSPDQESQGSGDDVVAPDRLPVPEPPEEVLQVQTGLASWYGGKFQGRLTASGEVFDTNQLTAAHKELPFGTRVRVVNPENGESVVVTINDRGPFVENRIIDLSRAAADAIGISGLGVARVRLEVLETPPESSLHVIQIGSFSDPDNAEQLVAELQNKGIPVEVQRSDQGHHRVVLASVSTETLPEYRRRLQEAGYPNVLVRSQE